MICACIFYCFKKYTMCRIKLMIITCCFIIENVNLLHIFHFDRGPGWLNELGMYKLLQNNFRDVIE